MDQDVGRIAPSCRTRYCGHADGEKKPSKRSKSESTDGAAAILIEKEGPRLCI